MDLTEGAGGKREGKREMVPRQFGRSVWRSWALNRFRGGRIRGDGLVKDKAQAGRTLWTVISTSEGMQVKEQA